MVGGGERCTQYFFGLEKFNYNKKQIRKMILDNVKTITTDSEIFKESAKFYENLYKSKISNEEGNPVEHYNSGIEYSREIHVWF